MERLYDNASNPVPVDLVGLDLEWDLLTTAWVAGKNCFFVAEPGVAKTMMGLLFSQTSCKSFFRKQMHAFTPPERIMGRTNLSLLRETGQEEIVVDGFLPSAEFALLDELFKTGKPSLDPLLTYLNEGVYESPTPKKGLTRCVFACSNEIPSGKAAADTEAFWDRLHIRHKLSRVRGELLEQVMERADDRDRCGGAFAIVPRDWSDEIAARPNVAVSRQIFQVVRQMAEAVEREKVVISPRRCNDLVHIAKAVAIIRGRSEVTTDDLVIAKWMFWNNLDEIPNIGKTVLSQIDPVGMELETKLNAALNVQNEASSQSFDENEPEQLAEKRRFFSAKNSELKGIGRELKRLADMSRDPRVADALTRVREIQREFMEFLIADVAGSGDVDI